MAGVAPPRLPGDRRPHPPSSLNSSGVSEDGSPPGLSTPPPSPPLQPETPTRKNKRKLSEPRRRGAADVSAAKRLCPDSPGGSVLSESGCSDDGGVGGDDSPPADPRHRGPRAPPAPHPGRRGQRDQRGARRRPSHEGVSSRESGSSRAPSEREDDVPGGRGGLIPGVAPHHPFFPAGLPSAAVFMPGFYHLADGRTAFPPAPFPNLHPLHGLASGGPGGSSSHPALGPLGGLDLDLTPNGPLAAPGALHPPAPDLGPRPDSPDNSGDEGSLSGGNGRRPRKNYKNMTRERRVEANARERTRVHTISAAFDALRRAVPSYSYNQKLSKLAILRIACTYIMALARLADVDCSAEPSVPVTFADCVDLCTRTIQTEGRARRRH